MEIVFKTSKVTFEGKLNNSQTAQKIYESLPLEAKVKTWGEEIYFEIPLNLAPENPTLDVEIGNIAYWPEGNSFCIFFGKTPISINNRPKPASEVNIIGKVTDLTILKNIKSGDRIEITKKIK